MTGMRGEAPGGNSQSARARSAGGDGRGPHGLLIVDKPSGPTSHDVVARVRRALGTKRAGHAGTLDPMASGVLVVLVGEATKLAPFLTAHDKRYEATIALGVATTTLDAEGERTAEEEVPGRLLTELAAVAEALGEARPDESGAATASIEERAPLLFAALAAESARTEQMPPAYSAIKIGGRRSYDLARAGEAIELAPRPIAVRALRPVGASAATDGGGRPFIALDVDVSKGYYVRSLAHDLGARLGVPSHLAALRRTHSGPFSIDQATPLDAGPRALLAALRPIAEAASQSLAVARLTAPGAARARTGKRLRDEDFSLGPPSTGELSAWLDPEGNLVAVGLAEHESLVIRRGFATPGEALDE